MSSSKLMGSSSDLNRKLSSCASTEFMKFDSGSSNGGDNFASDYLERNSGRERGHLPGLETESSSSTLLSTEIALLDAAGAIAPISDGEYEARRGVRRTVDDVWREIVAGKRKSEKQKPKEEMMTLEDFLGMVGAAEEAAEAEKGLLEVKEEQMSGAVYDHYDSKSDAGVVGDFGRGGGGVKRSVSLIEPLDKAAQQRKRRMIKNRESAARSRERKQAYRMELESMVARLEEENEQLLKEKEERKRKRLKQLMENVIPVVEKRRPPRLRRIRSMQW